MGGEGSGCLNGADRKLTTEGCLLLDVTLLSRDGVLDRDGNSGTLT